MIKNCLIAFFVFFGVRPPCFAASGAGTAGGKILKMNVGARASAMGNTYVGICGDATAVYWNPAGLTSLGDPQVSVMRGAWISGISLNYIAGVIPTSYGRIGIGLNYLSVGEIVFFFFFLRPGSEIPFKQD